MRFRSATKESTPAEAVFSIEVPLGEDPSSSERREVEMRRAELLRSYNSYKPTPSEPPIAIGKLADLAEFSKPLVQSDTTGNFDYSEFLKVGIKGRKRAAVYEVPARLIQFSEAISKIAMYHHAQHGWMRGKWLAGLTVEQSEVAPQTQQRPVNWVDPYEHVTLMDGPDVIHRDIKNGTTGQWSDVYAVSDTNPTQFYAGFSARNAFVNLGQIVPPPTQYQGEVGEIMYADTMAFHRSPVVEQAGMRTFLRMTYSQGIDLTLLTNRGE